MTAAHNWLIDHTGVGVSSIQASAAFYQAALEPLGLKALICISRTFGPSSLEDPDLGGVGFGIDYPVFWIDVFHPHDARQHTAFRAISREHVTEFHRRAISSGGTDNGPPGLRTGGYPAGYYAAFVHDPDGHNVEVVFRE